MNVANYVTSLIRTVVPALWGTVIAWLVSRELIPQAVADSIANGATLFLVTGAISGYYALARWLETRKWVPPWISAILLGTKTVPAYLTQYAAGLTKAVPVAADSPKGSRLVGSPADEQPTDDLTDFGAGARRPSGSADSGEPEGAAPRHRLGAGPPSGTGRQVVE